MPLIGDRQVFKLDRNGAHGSSVAQWIAAQSGMPINAT